MGSIHAVFDKPDSIRADGLLTLLNNRQAGRCASAIESSSGDLEALANAVLTSLGKRSLARDLQRSAAIKWQHTLAWLDAEEISCLILAGTEDLRHQARDRLVELASSRDLWLIYDNDKAEKWLRRYDPEMLTADEFVAAWKDTTPPQPLAARPPYPRVPREEFARFRSTCHTELSGEDFRRVNSTWRTAHAETMNWLHHAGASVNEEQIAGHLRALITHCGDHEEAIVVIRATQAALWLHRYRLKVLMPRFTTAAKLAHPADLERGIADQLRWYTRPARAAAGLIRLLDQSASFTEIAELAPHAVAADGSSFSIANLTTHVPEVARPLLRAQHHLLQRLDPGSPRFLSYSRGRKVLHPTATVINRWLRDISQEAGVSLVGVINHRARLDAPGWVSRRGLSIERLFPPNA